MSWQHCNTALASFRYQTPCKLKPWCDHPLMHVVDSVQALQLEQEIVHLQHEAQQLQGHNEGLQAQLRSQGPDDRRVAELEGENFVFRLTCILTTYKVLEHAVSVLLTACLPQYAQCRRAPLDIWVAGCTGPVNKRNGQQHCIQVTPATPACGSVSQQGSSCLQAWQMRPSLCCRS